MAGLLTYSTFEAFPFAGWRKVTIGFKSFAELTAAGTAQDLHLFPYYATCLVRQDFAPLLSTKVVLFRQQPVAAGIFFSTKKA